MYFIIKNIIYIIISTLNKKKFQKMLNQIVFILFYILILIRVLSFLNLLNSSLIKIVTLICALLYLFRKKNVIISKIKSFFIFCKKNFLLFLYLFFCFSIFIILTLSVYPNNWDSMTYHLPRIFHWFQNKNINFYPTSIPRQIYMAPFDEIVLAFFYGLTQNELFFSFAHLIIIIFILITAIELTKKIYKKENFYIIILILSTPIIILQSTSTQNNLLLALILMLIYYYIFEIKNNLYKLDRKKLSINLAILAFLLNLSIYTKGTAYFFLFPIGIYLLFLLKRKLNLFLKFIIFSVVLFITINGQFFLNNYYVFNSFFPQESKLYSQNNLVITPKVLLSNITRNLGYQLISKNNSLNKFLNDQILKLHKLIDQDINDPKTTWYGTQFSMLNFSIENEDSAPNFYLIILTFISTVFFIFNYKRINKKIILIFLLNFFGFITFNLFLKWQPWHTRLLIPLTIMLNFIILEFLNHLNKFLKYFVLIFLIYNSLPFYFYNTGKPLFPIENNILTKDSITQITYNRPDTTSSFKEFNKYFSINKNNIKKIGLVIGRNDYEYPFWHIIKLNNANTKIVHCFITNESKKLDLNNSCKDIDLLIITKERLYEEKVIRKKIKEKINLFYFSIYKL